MESTNKEMNDLKQDISSRGIQSLLTEQAELHKQFDDLSEKLNVLNEALATGQKANWSLILEDIRQRTPKQMHRINL